MNYSSNTAALQLVRDELVTLCHEAGAAIDSFVSDWTQRSGLDTVVQALLAARGTYDLLELPAARMLCQEALESVQELPFNPDANAHAQLETMSYALALLARYTEYVSGKTCDVPELLLPTLNQLRLLKGKAELPPSHFFVMQLPTGIVLPRNQDDLEFTGRRQRILFQLGLLHVLTKPRAEPGLALMARSAGMLAEMSQDRAADVWKLAGHVLRALPEVLSLSTPRKRLLSQLERYLSEQLKAAKQGAFAPPPEALLRGLLYTVSLFDKRIGPIDSLLKRYQAQARQLTQADLDEAAAKLAAPSESTYRHVLEQIREELGTLHADLRGKQVITPNNTLDGVVLAAAIRRLAQTLHLIEQQSLAQELMGTIAIIERASQPILAGGTTILELTAALARLRLSLDTRLSAQRVRSELDGVEKHAPATNETRAAALADVRAYFRELMQAFDTYVATDSDASHIVRVPEMLQRMCHALTFSKLETMAEPLQECSGVLLQAMEHGQKLPRDVLLVLADIFTATDYALECLVYQQPVPPHVYQVTQRAQADLRELHAVA